MPGLKKKAVFYEDEKVYAALSSHPIARGHVVVMWKKEVSDLHLLEKKDYKHLMNAVNKVRNSMLKTLGIKKVYLIYMDEAKHVHWHLVPRYNEKGFDIFHHKPKKLKDFSLAEKLRRNFVAKS
ncbi:HIT family protein [Candidatus Pacearchaeota archaeon]|nr:HIT family protein [Candidatus Pacearchaeota archaeon]